MAFATDIRAAGTAGIQDKFIATFKGLMERAAQHKMYRTTFDELNALSDRDLTDLGLNRSMIKGVALESSHNV